MEVACAVRRIVKGGGTHIAAQLFDVFHQYVSFALVLHYIGLKAQRILVECYQFLVFQ